MPLTRWERKERLGHGAVTKLARRTRRSLALVSEVVNGKRRHPVIERAAAKMMGLTVEEAFGPMPSRTPFAPPRPSTQDAA